MTYKNAQIWHCKFCNIDIISRRKFFEHLKTCEAKLQLPHDSRGRYKNPLAYEKSSKTRKELFLEGKLNTTKGNKLSDEHKLSISEGTKKYFIQFEFKNQLSQIYQNWCLLYYVKQTKDKIESANHWSEELLTAIMNVSSMKLINGNKRKKVYDALKEMFYTKLEYGNADLNMKCRLTKKFENEKIVYDLNELQEAFKNSINQLMTLIAYSNDTDIERYCYEFWK